MDVNAVGFKTSEIGLIPADWEAVSLSRTAKKITRGASPRPIESPIWFDNRSQVGWVRISDVTSSHRFLSETTQRLSSAGIRSSRYVPSGSLIMSICATVGRPIETRIDTCIHDGFVVFDQPTVDQEFLYYVLEALEPTWSRSGQTGSQMNLNTGLINGRVIALPASRTEQRAIAAVLSDVDALLGGLDRLIAKKRDLKQAAMQQLLTGQTRLPGFQGEWEVKRLSDVADPSQRWSFTGGPFGSNLKSSDYTDDGVRIIQLQNIGDGVFLDDYKIFTSKSKADELISCNIYPGEIILSKMGDPVARACIIPSTHDRYLMCSDGIRLAVDQRNFSSYFIYSMINAPEFRDKAASAGTGSTRKRIGLAELRSLELRCPSFREQTAIAAALADMDAELSALESRREKTRALKQAMMQELLTGRTRLV